ncbi:putative plastid-lipid-associated protein 4, chloroplastic [Silene latifolia]
MSSMALSSAYSFKSFPANESSSSSIRASSPALSVPSTFQLSTTKPSFSNKPLLLAAGDQLLNRSNVWKTRVSFFPAFLTNKSKDAKAVKEQLLQAIQPLDRGADATLDDQQTIDQLTRKLEALNPTKEPLKSDLLNGKWELIYTTSTSILQTQRPKFLRSRVNYQAINADTLRAQNMESWPFFNQVTADLTPVNSKKVAVKFDYFKIGGLIPVKAPDRARGSLEITYLDEDLRVSRGDKGNLFILKMIDRSYRVPTK